MSAVRNFLVEIGCEELPPKSLNQLAQSFSDGVVQGLEKAQLAFGKISVFATPRRLALLVHGLAEQQHDRIVERRGPLLSAARDASGTPTPAALGFARSCGVEFDELQTIETDKGPCLNFRFNQTGSSTQQLLPAIIETALRQLPIPKPMRWADHSIEFIRPVHWVVMLFGSDVVDAEILGNRAGRTSRGHRYHHPETIEITDPLHYEELLKTKGFVIANFATRRNAIEQQVHALAESNKIRAVIEPALLDEVTAIVEWPNPLLVNFDKQFLSVPAEALIAAMHDHQKCFYTVDENQRLLPHFITVSNIQSRNPEFVVDGNARVMRARLSDAKFFYETDLKLRLDSYLERLRHVTYQAKLGTQLERAQRISSLAKQIAKKIGANVDDAARAGLLAKCDLMSTMVNEFPKLQGIMGDYYARNDGEGADVATAIVEHYYPRFSGDMLPTSNLGCAVALADRIDMLLGIFAIEQIPTGDKDPYGLRRAALGVVRILITKQFDLSIEDLLKEAAANFSNSIVTESMITQVHEFILERLRAWYVEHSIDQSVIAAVLARQKSQLFDVDKRINAVTAFLQLPQAQALSAANKRVSRILLKEDVLLAKSEINRQLLTDTSEKQLADEVISHQNKIAPLYAAHDYQSALTLLADLREPVDDFFEKVMVMVDDISIRNNRLTLLAKLRELLSKVADISLLQ